MSQPIVFGDKMRDTWNILVVDDEPDVQEVTELAFRRMAWQGRGIGLTIAGSAEDALNILQGKEPGFFEVAIIDVVMESEHAGLTLCRHIRKHFALSLRIILRTGQPGFAPEDKVMSDYDIDHYLPKADATPERIYALTRACLRVSQEIATVLELTNHLKDFTAIVPHMKGVDALLQPIDDRLRFLERKHGVVIGLFLLARDGEKLMEEGRNVRAGIDHGRSFALFESWWSNSGAMEFLGRSRIPDLSGSEAVMFIPLFPGNSLGSPNKVIDESLHKDFSAWLGRVVLRSEKWDEMLQQVLPSEGCEKSACLHILLGGQGGGEAQLAGLEGDLKMFAEIWRLVYAAYSAQKNMAQVREMLDNVST